MTNTDLLDELREIMDDTFLDLNESGVNISARFPVQLVTYEYTGGDEHKGDPGAESIVGSPIDVTVIDLSLSDVHEWKNFNQVHVGDARLEISQHVLSKDDILGANIDPGKKRYFLIGDNRYTVVNGGVRDPDGLIWRITLKRVKP